MVFTRDNAKSIKWILLLLLIIPLVKCMGPRRETYYIYEPVLIEKDGFTIHAGLIGDFRYEEHYFYEIITKGPPYFLSVRVVTPNLDNVNSVKVLEVTLIGEDNGEVIEVSNLSLSKEDFGFERISRGYASGLRFKNLELVLQPYLVEGQIEICSNDKCWVEDFSATLNYTIEYEYGFTAIDRFMSV